MSTITPLSASSVTRAVNESVGSGRSLSDIMMSLAKAFIELEQTKSTNTAKSAQSNVNQLDAANQLTSQLKRMEALRIEKKIDKDKTMEGQATDSAQFVKNLKDAGITVSADEYTKWSAGKMTDADLKTIESRIKAMSDRASSQSQMTNLDLQKSNNAIQQNTNMFMSFMDAKFKSLERIFR